MTGGLLYGWYPYPENDSRASCLNFRAIRRICDFRKDIAVVEWCEELQILPANYLNPLCYENWEDFYDDKSADEVINAAKNSYAVHFFAAKVRNDIPENFELAKDSRAPYITFAEENCPRVLEASTTFH